jgi:hypothetical protein
MNTVGVFLISVGATILIVLPLMLWYVWRQ